MDGYNDWLKVSFGRNRKGNAFCQMLLAPLVNQSISHSTSDFALRVSKEDDYTPCFINVRIPISADQDGPIYFISQGVQIELILSSNISQLISVNQVREQIKSKERKRRKNWKQYRGLFSEVSEGQSQRGQDSFFLEKKAKEFNVTIYAPGRQITPKARAYRSQSRITRVFR